jgi:hypothetical protein
VSNETPEKKLKIESSPETDIEKISSRPFQYLSTVPNKAPGTIVTIKGKLANDVSNMSYLASNLAILTSKCNINLKNICRLRCNSSRKIISQKKRFIHEFT